MKLLPFGLKIACLCIIINANTCAQTNCFNFLKKADDIYSSNPDSSFSYSKLALDCATELKDSLQIAQAYSHFGRYYLLKSNLNESEAYLNKAEEYFSQLNKNAGLAQVYKLKAILQSRIHNNKEAILFAEKAVDLYSHLPPKNGLIGAMQNLTNYYFHQSDTQKLQQIFLRLDSLLPQMDETSKYYHFQNKARFLMLKKFYQSTDSLLHQAYNIALRENMVDSKATITMIMGRNFRLMNKLHQSEKILKESEIICKENKLDHELVETYTELVETYKALGNDKTALFYFEILTQVNNKNINLEKVNEIASLEKKLMEAQKQKEIDNEKFKTNVEVGKNKKLALTILLISALLFISIYLFIRTRKLKNSIHEKSLVIQQKAMELADRQKEIIDSINYAKKIQYALLANRNFINQNIPNNFIFFKPKDIVSGDFYWAASTTSGKFYIAVCDSTGHGVPGAFMSLLSIGFLSEAINEKRIEKPNEVFDYVRTRLITSMANEGQKDGFDGILLCIDKIKSEITYAASNNKPILIEDNTIKELPTDKMPVGFGIKNVPFNLYNIQYKSNSTLYLYTDGYADQFGGAKGKKFKYKTLNELLLNNSNKPILLQVSILEKAFDDWKGTLEQVDDVCVMGIQL